jgi:hypothetical protein
MMLGAAFTAFFASLITAGSHWAGMSLSAALRAGSAVILVSAIYMLVTVPARLRRLDPAQAEAFSSIATIAFGLIIVLNVVAQSIVVANVLPQFSRGLFLYGLVLNLGVASFMLVRILFSRPGGE